MPYRDVLLKAIKDSGRSARDISIAATGHESAIRSLKRGHDLRGDTIEAMCKELGLEFYVGPSRAEPQEFEELAPLPVQAAAEGGAGSMGRPVDFAGNIRRGVRELVRVAIGLGQNPIPPDLWPILLAHAGETLPAGNERIAAAADAVTVVELEAAAGDNGGQLLEEQKGLVWFRRGWLERRGISAETCIIIGVTGDSMEPGLPDGCSILVDRSSREWTPRRVLVVHTAGSLLVKRAAEDEDGNPVMTSDNPYWPPAPLPEGAEIVGRVRWMAYSID